MVKRRQSRAPVCRLIGVERAHWLSKSETTRSYLCKFIVIAVVDMIVQRGMAGRIVTGILKCGGNLSRMLFHTLPDAVGSGEEALRPKVHYETR